MLKLDNISFKEYVELQDKTEYDFAIEYSFPFHKEEDIFNIGSFTNLEFGLVKDIQYDISNGLLWSKMLEYMAELSKKDIEYIYKLPLISVIQFRNYIVAQIKYIVDIEDRTLSYEPSSDELNAGISELNKYGVYNQFLTIAGNDPLKIDAVRKMKYEDAFVFLCYQKDHSDFERRLMEIRTKPE